MKREVLFDDLVGLINEEIANNPDCNSDEVKNLLKDDKKPYFSLLKAFFATKKMQEMSDNFSFWLSRFGIVFPKGKLILHLPFLHLGYLFSLGDSTESIKHLDNSEVITETEIQKYLPKPKFSSEVEYEKGIEFFFLHEPDNHSRKDFIGAAKKIDKDTLNILMFGHRNFLFKLLNMKFGLVFDADGKKLNTTALNPLILGCHEQAYDLILENIHNIELCERLLDLLANAHRAVLAPIENRSVEALFTTLVTKITSFFQELEPLPQSPSPQSTDYSPTQEPIRFSFGEPDQASLQLILIVGIMALVIGIVGLVTLLATPLAPVVITPAFIMLDALFGLCSGAGAFAMAFAVSSMKYEEKIAAETQKINFQEGSQLNANDSLPPSSSLADRYSFGLTNTFFNLRNNTQSLSSTDEIKEIPNNNRTL